MGVLEALSWRGVVNDGSGLFFLLKIDQVMVTHEPRGHLVRGLFYNWRGI